MGRDKHSKPLTHANISSNLLLDHMTCYYSAKSRKRVNIMRKYLIGILLGASLMFSAQAFGAAATLIGKKISREVKVIIMGAELEKKAILLDGTTYVPLRVITEKLGLQAEYVNGEVVVRNKSAELAEYELKITKKMKEVEDTKEAISLLQSDIKLQEQRLVDENGRVYDIPAMSPQAQLERLRPRLTEAESKLANLQQELIGLQAIKADLEAKAQQ